MIITVHLKIFSPFSQIKMNVTCRWSALFPPKTQKDLHRKLVKVSNSNFISLHLMAKVSQTTYVAS